MMKAHINGITIEGTPQEIMEYQRMQAQTKPVPQFLDVRYPFWPQTPSKTAAPDFNYVPSNTCRSA